MGFRLNKVDYENIVELRKSNQLKAGDWWYCPWYLDLDKFKRENHASFLSEHYLRDWNGLRDPVCIRLPGGDDWCIDQKSSNGSGWTVTGEEGLWTANPSILVPNYHGFLRDGVLSDDTDGRTYP